MLHDKAIMNNDRDIAREGKVGMCEQILVEEVQDSDIVDR